MQWKESLHFVKRYKWSWCLHCNCLDHKQFVLDYLKLRMIKKKHITTFGASHRGSQDAAQHHQKAWAHHFYTAAVNVYYRIWTDWTDLENDFLNSDTRTPVFDSNIIRCSFANKSVYSLKICLFLHFLSVWIIWRMKAFCPHHWEIKEKLPFKYRWTQTEPLYRGLRLPSECYNFLS